MTRFNHILYYHLGNIFEVVHMIILIICVCV